jgi:hypothetical protein
MKEAAIARRELGVQTSTPLARAMMAAEMLAAIIAYPSVKASISQPQIF